MLCGSLQVNKLQVYLGLHLLRYEVVAAVIKLDFTKHLNFNFGYSLLSNQKDQELD